jgi:hypothetical protein
MAASKVTVTVTYQEARRYMASLPVKERESGIGVTVASVYLRHLMEGKGLERLPLDDLKAVLWLVAMVAALLMGERVEVLWTGQEVGFHFGVADSGKGGKSIR